MMLRKKQLSERASWADQDSAFVIEDILSSDKYLGSIGHLPIEH